MEGAFLWKNHECRLRVCGVLWTRISVKKRRPRALDSAHRLLHFLLPYSSICLPLFPLRDHLVTFFFTSITSLSFCFHSFFHSSPNLPLFSNVREFHRLAFVFFLHPSFFLPLSRIPLPRSTRAEDRRTYMPAASRIPLLARVCCSNSFVPRSGHFLLLSLSFAPLQPPFLFFHSLFSLLPLGLTAAHASDHPGCEKRRVVWTEKRLIFIRSLSFSIVMPDPFVSYSVSLPLFFAR